MEKYKLLKDLPNAKAGEIFELRSGGNLYKEKEVLHIFFTQGEIEANGILDRDKGWFEKIEEKKYGGRVPKERDYYYVIEDSGNIGNAYWNDTQVDKARFESGSAFWTQEEAEKELARRKAYVILKEDTKGFEPDWYAIDEPKYFVGYKWGARGL